MKGTQIFFIEDAIPASIRQLKLSKMPLTRDLASALRILGISTFRDLVGVSLRDFQRVSDKSAALFLELSRLIKLASGKGAVSADVTVGDRLRNGRHSSRERKRVAEAAHFSGSRGRCVSPPEQTELPKRLGRPKIHPRNNREETIYIGSVMQPNRLAAFKAYPEPKNPLPPDFIRNLNLSVRATNVLSRIDLHSCSDLRWLSEEFLRRQRNCGRKTVAEIMGALKTLPDQAVFDAQLESTLPPHFAEGLNLGVRAINVLRGMNLQSYSDVLAISEESLSTQRSCGKKTVAEIMEALERLKNRFPQLQPAHDFASPISALGLSTSTANAIRRLGIESIRDLALASDEQLRTPQLTFNTLTDLRGKLCDFFVTSEKRAELLDDQNPTEYPRLSVRTSKTLKALNMTTVGQLARARTWDFLELPNFGKKSLYEIRTKLLDYLIEKGVLDGKGKYEQVSVPSDPNALIATLLTELSEDLRDIVIRRFGLWHRKPETLEDVGDSRGCTRERIRQLESKALASLRWPGNSKMVRCFLDRLYRNHLRSLLVKGLGIATEDELRSAFLTLFASPEEAVPIERLISKAFLNGKTLYDGSCLKTDDGLFAADEEACRAYLSAIKTVEAYLRRTQKPTTLSKLVAVALKPRKAGSPRMAKEAVVRFIQIAPNIRTDEHGVFGLAQWRYMRPKTLRDMIVRALVEIGKPAHFTQIAMCLNERFSPSPPLKATSIHARLVDDHETFVWQASGVYGLSAWGLKRAPYVKDRLVQILTSARQPMSLDQIVPKVLETCRCNEQTPAAILEAHPAVFIRLDKSVYGLREWAP